MLEVLQRKSTLICRILYSGDSSLVQISIETDILASHLNGDIALGPAYVIVDIERNFSKFHVFTVLFSSVNVFAAFQISGCAGDR